MVRASVGIEDVDDLIWDLDQALEKSQAATPVAVATHNGLGHSILSKAFGAPYQD